MKTTYAVFCMCAFAFAGCATIPPQALTHVSALKDYQKKTATATIGAFDSSTATLRYTVEAWKQTDAAHSQEYIEACKEASQVFSASQDTLREITDLLARLPGEDAAGQADVHSKIGARIKDLQEELDARKASFDGAAATVEKRAATNAQEFTSHIREVELAAGKIKTLMSSHSDVVTEELATEESLFRSYLGAQSKIDEVFGPALSAHTEYVTSEAGKLSDEYSPLIAAIESILKR